MRILKDIKGGFVYIQISKTKLPEILDMLLDIVEKDEKYHICENELELQILASFTYSIDIDMKNEYEYILISMNEEQSSIINKIFNKYRSLVS